MRKTFRFPVAFGVGAAPGTGDAIHFFFSFWACRTEVWDREAESLALLRPYALDKVRAGGGRSDWIPKR